MQGVTEMSVFYYNDGSPPKGGLNRQNCWEFLLTNKYSDLNYRLADETIYFNTLTDIVKNKV